MDRRPAGARGSNAALGAALEAIVHFVAATANGLVIESAGAGDPVEAAASEGLGDKPGDPSSLSLIEGTENELEVLFPRIAGQCAHNGWFRAAAGAITE